MNFPWTGIKRQIETLQRRMDTYLDLLAVLKEAVRIDAIGAADALERHACDTTAHTTEHERQSRCEWREAVTERLARIESLILDIRKMP